MVGLISVEVAMARSSFGMTEYGCHMPHRRRACSSTVGRRWERQWSTVILPSLSLKVPNGGARCAGRGEFNDPYLTSRYVCEAASHQDGDTKVEPNCWLEQTVRRRRSGAGRE